jgi:proline dehydrogenase
MMAHAIPFLPRALIQRVSRRYIAGHDLPQAVARIEQLNAKGYPVTVDVLGESVATPSQAEAMAGQYDAVLEAISDHRLRASISITPTAMGMLIDGQTCRARIERLLRRAAACDTGVCLDMEDLSCTQLEIDLFRGLRQHHENVSLALQAYLHRTYDDLHTLLGDKTQLRLCKGIYVEEREHLVDGAWKDRSAINPHFLAHVQRCFESATYVSVATHDRALIDAVLALAKRLGTRSDQFEFQMLLGVCEPLRDELHEMGLQVRIYVPFGKDWYGYSTRRIKENPQIAGYLARALIKG